MNNAILTPYIDQSGLRHHLRSQNLYPCQGHPLSCELASLDLQRMRPFDACWWFNPPNPLATSGENKAPCLLLGFVRNEQYIIETQTIHPKHCCLSLFSPCVFRTSKKNGPHNFANNRIFLIGLNFLLLFIYSPRVAKNGSYVFNRMRDLAWKVTKEEF